MLCTLPLSVVNCGKAEACGNRVALHCNMSESERCAALRLLVIHYPHDK